MLEVKCNSVFLAVCYLQLTEFKFSHMYNAILFITSCAITSMCLLFLYTRLKFVQLTAYG